eukprot:CAMPEP_0116890026 /NCGR_PEP_ID=MMETSP0467-20121206/569_1 /TAXON_ID=283647 /ORGANISM="Mesodinium pulex, Strain SPMC105" /LENGTH=66 /DNA_ID=CAMNT_0004557383 /DNA_START=784 /DNA_END=984 /DNA_ORIENTATION=-
MVYTNDRFKDLPKAVSSFLGKEILVKLKRHEPFLRQQQDAKPSGVVDAVMDSNNLHDLYYSTMNLS